MFRLKWAIWGFKAKNREEIDGALLSIETWKDFERSLIWKAFAFDINDRRSFLTELLVNGSPKWSDEQIRGRIHELEYFENIPAMIKMQLSQNAENSTIRDKEN